jgi:Ca2+-binding EF-hand superfamily protein
VDGDGAFTQVDADLLTHAIFDPASLTTAQREQADLTGDGAISAADLAALGQVLANCERWGRFQWKPGHSQARRRYALTFIASDGTLTDIEPITVAVDPFWGDYDHDGVVTIDELLRAVNLVLSGPQPGEDLSWIDRNGDMQVTVDEVLSAVNNALHGPSASSVQAAIDRSGDGIISRLELQQWMATLQNHPPVFGALPTISPVTAGQLLFANISAADADDQELAFSATGLPSGARLLPLGDVTMNGTLSALDAAWILQASVGLRSFSEEQRLLADVTQDGTISAVDANYILEANVKLRRINKASLFWRPSPTQVGRYTISLTVSDGSQSTSTCLTISVQPLWGDLNADGQVSVDEIIRATNFALGTVTPTASELSRIDRNNDSQVTVDEVMAAVSNALR